jgi:Ca2+-dependent lipid-binding protein
LKENEKIGEEEVAVIDLEIIYEAEMYGILEITVESALLIRDTEIIGKMDPYAKLIMGDVIHRTTVKNDAGKSPIWN